MRKVILVFFFFIVAVFLLLYSGLPFSILRPVFHADSVSRHCEKYKIDPVLVTAIIKVESNFFRNAKSHRGAVGLMQLLPSTAQELAPELGLKKFNAKDLEQPDINIRLGTYYLYKLKKEFMGDEVLALAAYNAGLGKVQSWHMQNPLISFDIADIPYKETRNYVTNVMKTYRWLKTIQTIKNRLLPGKS